MNGFCALASVIIVGVAASRTAMPTPSPDVASAESENWDDPCDCAIGLQERIQHQEEAARSAEPKDASWAYETEQLLQQFIAADPKTSAIEISGVECRTSFCEIRAIGTPELQQVFSELIQAVELEPWSTFKGRSAVGFSIRDDGRKDFDAILGRTPDARLETGVGVSASVARAGGCQCATEEWQERKRAHDEAERAAEAKDIDWAYATEQAFQQRVAEHAQAFVEFSVDCRTTYCDVRATGMTPESADVFDQILDEVFAQQSLGLAGGTGSTEKSEQGGTMIMRVDRR